MANLRASAVVVLSMLVVVWSRDLTFDAAELSPAMTQDSELSDADVQKMADAMNSLVQASSLPHASADVETVEMVEMMKGLLERLERHIARDVVKADNESLSGTDDVDSSCHCWGASCSCCANVDLKSFHWNSCVHVAFIPSHRTVVLVLSVNGHAILRETVSIDHPPPLCVKYFGASLCLKFSNIWYSHRSLNACMDVKAGFLFIKKTVRLGCFKIHV